jgi:hypothetical protein
MADGVYAYWADLSILQTWTPMMLTQASQLYINTS